MRSKSVKGINQRNLGTTVKIELKISCVCEGGNLNIIEVNMHRFMLILCIF